MVSGSLTIFSITESVGSPSRRVLHMLSRSSFPPVETDAPMLSSTACANCIDVTCLVFMVEIDVLSISNERRLSIRRQSSIATIESMKEETGFNATLGVVSRTRHEIFMHKSAAKYIVPSRNSSPDKDTFDFPEFMFANLRPRCIDHVLIHVTASIIASAAIAPARVMVPKRICVSIGRETDILQPASGGDPGTANV